jgi:hypothetical protein
MRLLCRLLAPLGLGRRAHFTVNRLLVSEAIGSFGLKTALLLADITFVSKAICVVGRGKWHGLIELSGTLWVRSQRLVTSMTCDDSTSGRPYWLVRVYWVVA